MLQKVVIFLVWHFFWGGGVHATPFSPTERLLVFEKAARGSGVQLRMSGDQKGIATFIHMGYFCVAVPQGIKLSLALQPPPHGFSKPEILRAEGGSVVRLKIPQDLFPVITSVPQKGLCILLTRQPSHDRLPQKTFSPHILTMDAGTQTAFLDVPHTGVVTYKDPLTHKTLFLLLTAEPWVGFPCALRKCDFALQPTYQGVVIEASPHVSLREEKNGIYLSSAGGLKVSPSQDAAFAGRKKTHLRHLFGHFNPDKIPELQKKLRHAEGVSRVFLEWELARQQIMAEKVPETMAFLRLLAAKYPAWEEGEDFRILTGVGRFLDNQLLVDFYSFSSSLDPQEMQPFIQATRLKSGEGGVVLGRVEKLLEDARKLPQPFKGNFFLLAAQAAIQKDAPKLALKILRSLPRALTPAQEIYSKNLLKQMVFEPLLPGPPVDGTKSALTQPRHYLSHEAHLQTKLETLLSAHKIGRISDKGLIRHLLTIKWDSKSDAFGSQILKLLGELYAKENQPLKSLEAYRSFLHRYKEASDYGQVRERAVNVYRGALVDGSLSFVKKIGLFKQFQEFLTETGERPALMRLIVEEMLQHNLIDDAMTLIEKEVVTQPDSLLILKLADIQLLNKNPEKARALLIRHADRLSASHAQRFQSLQIRCLEEEKKYTQALLLVPDDADHAHQLQRAGLLMRNKQWREAALALKRAEGTQKLSVRWMEKWAFCLYEGGEMDALRQLVSDERIKKSPFLTLLSQVISDQDPKDLKGVRAFLQALPRDLNL